MKRSIEPDERQSRLQQAEDPRHAVGPACLVLELGEDKVRLGLLGSGEEDDANDHHAKKRPVYCSCLVRGLGAWQSLINLHAASFHLPRILLPQILPPVVNVKIARKIRYVFQASASYASPDAITTAADINCEAKKPSVVTRVSHPAMFVHPTQKL